MRSVTRVLRSRSASIPSRALALALAAATFAVGGAAVPGSGLQPAVVINRGPATSGAVALTFDDGWSPVMTARIVGILETRGVRATFFPQADAVRAAPGLWRHIAEAGFPIGNHTVTHADLTRLGPDDQLTEIDGARRAIETITGHPMIPVLRPTYGRVDAGVLRAAAATGFPALVRWDVAGGDWSETDPAVVARDALSGSAGSVVLLHAGPAVTVRALPAIIDGYLARGLRFVTIPELLARPG